MVATKVRGWRPVTTAGAAAFAALPAAYALERGAEALQPAVVCALTGAIIATGALVVYRAAPQQRQFFYVLCACAFASSWSLVGALEGDGWLRGFAGRLLKPARPYRSPWTVVAAYLHGLFDLGCYLHMAYRVSNGWLFRNVAIFHAANLLLSSAVATLGAFLSNRGLQWGVALNAPYAAAAAHILWTAIDAPQSRKMYLPTRCAMRSVSVVLLVITAFVCLVRGAASMGSRVEALALWREQVEPLLNQKSPSPFAALQAIVAMFYLAPACLVLATAVAANPFRLWLRDLAVAAAGAAFQVEVCLVGMQWHPLTEAVHHLGPDASNTAISLHMCAHLLTLLAPAFCAFALCRVDGPSYTPPRATVVQPPSALSVNASCRHSHSAAYSCCNATGTSSGNPLPGRSSAQQQPQQQQPQQQPPPPQQQQQQQARRRQQGRKPTNRADKS